MSIVVSNNGKVGTRLRVANFLTFPGQVWSVFFCWLCRVNLEYIIHSRESAFFSLRFQHIVEQAEQYERLLMTLDSDLYELDPNEDGTRTLSERGVRVLGKVAEELRAIRAEAGVPLVLRPGQAPPAGYPRPEPDDNFTEAKGDE